MFYNNNCASEDLDFFKQMENCPEIKEKLRRGVKLTELARIRQFLEANQLDSYFQKQYGFIVEGIRLVRDFHMDCVPEAATGAYLTTRDHWIGVSGYFNVGIDQLAYECMESKWIINIMALRTRMLIMNTDAYRTFRMFVALRPKVNRLVILRVTLIALHLLRESDAPFSIFMTPSFVKYLWYKYGYLDESALPYNSIQTYEHLMQGSAISDDIGLIRKLLEESYCMPSGSTYSDDGWFHFMTLPTWTLGISPYNGFDYTGNYITDWDYLVTTE